MSFLATHLVGFGSGGGGAVGNASIAFAAAAVSTSNVTDSTYTFSSHSIGTAASDRYVIVAVACRGSFASATIASVTVAGTSCTQAVASTSTAGTAQIWITNAAITSGTTGDVVVTTGGGAQVNNCGIGTYAATGLASATASATNTTTSDNTARSLAVTAGGIAVGLMRSNEAATGSAVAWTNITERYDAIVESGQSIHSGACDNQAADATLSLTADDQNNSGSYNVAYAAWS